MRHYPDIFVIGEMREPETINAALQAASAGHLIIGILNTNDTSQAVDRLVEVFPKSQQAQIRVQLSQALIAVFPQVLVPGTKTGRIPACEIMVVNTTIRNSIKEGKTQFLQSAIQLGTKEKMQTLNQALVKLVTDKEISVQPAMHCSMDKEQLMNLVG
jgi:twitching motility protein PilT